MPNKMPLTLKVAGGKKPYWYVYLPAKLVEDSTFPFSEDDIESLCVEIRGKEIIIRRQASGEFDK
jgi:hypothetical protein